MNRKSFALAAILGLAAGGAAAETVSLDNIPQANNNRMHGILTTAGLNGHITTNTIENVYGSQACLALAYTAATAAYRSSVACYVSNRGVPTGYEVQEIFTCAKTITSQNVTCERLFRR